MLSASEIMQTKECESCGVRVARLYDTANGSDVCMDCLSDYFFYCEECRGYQPNEEHSFDSNFGSICEECRDKFMQCVNCDELLHEEGGELFVVDGEVYCDTCFTDLFRSCDECGEIVLRENMMPLHPVILICEECFSMHYFECEECSGIYHVDDHGGDGLCADCHDERNSGLIESYGHTVAHTFKGSEGPYFGLEIEVEAEKGDREEIAQETCETEFRIPFNLKEDGSLSDGFELVTQPANLSYIQSAEWDKLLGNMKRAGARAHDTSTCGLHIHISRGSLSENEEIKMAMLVYTQQRLFKDLSRRGSVGYSKYCDMNEKKTKDLNKNRDRYEGLNFNPTHTIEFRIFKGTIRPVTLLARVELVHAVYNVAKDKSFSCVYIAQNTQRTRTRLLNHIKQNKGTYPNLNEYLYERNW